MNLSNNGIVKINSNQSEKEIIQQNANDNLESNNLKNQEKLNEMDFENCNIYLKNAASNNKRPYSRKRSAFKYIEDNLEKDKVKNSSIKNQTNNLLKNLNLNDNDNINNFASDNNEKNNFNNANSTNINFYNENKPKVMESSTFSQNILNDKKPEYESRRKKQINFMNCIDSITQDKTYGSTNNIITNQTQNNFQKFNDSNQSNPNTNFISGTYESRRFQINNSKPITFKDKGDILDKNKIFFNK